jgi:sugar diacid utilization regulator
VLVVSSRRTRLESLRKLVVRGLDKGGKVAILRGSDGAGDVVEDLDSAGLGATAAAAEGRLGVRTATASDLPTVRGRSMDLATAARPHDGDLTAVVVELGSDTFPTLDVGASNDVGADPCDVGFPPDVATTCLATLEDTPPHVLLAAVDRHAVVVVAGRRLGGAIAGPSAVPPLELRLQAYVAMLPLIEDPIRLAELEAAMLARLADTPGAAVLVPGLGVGPIGEVDDRPLGPSRQQQLATRLTSGQSSPDLGILSIPTREPGTAVLLMREDERLDGRQRTAVETLLGVAACCHDKLVDNERLDALATANVELRSTAAMANDNARLIQTMSLLVADGDLEGALECMSAHVDCRLALVDPGGTLIAGSPEVARTHQCASRRRRTGRSRTVVPPLSPRGTELAQLCSDGDVGDISEDLWESLTRLLAAGLERRRAERWASEASEASLVLALVRDEDAADFEHRRWAERLHLDLARPYRVVMLSPGPGDDIDEMKLDAWARRIASLSLPVRPRVAKTPDGLVCLWPEQEEAPEDWADRCRYLLRHLRPGAPGCAAVGSPGTYPTGLEESHEQARRLSRLQRRQDAVPLAVPRVAVIEQAGLIADMLGPTEGRHLAPFIRRVLGSLLDDPRCGGELVETLGAHLASGGRPAQTAERLHLHRSSVKYRVQLLRDVLGDRLDDPDHRFELELAIRLLGTFESLGADDGRDAGSRASDVAVS